MRSMTRVVAIGLLVPALALGVSATASAAPTTQTLGQITDSLSDFTPISSVVVGDRVVSVASYTDGGPKYGLYSYNKDGSDLVFFPAIDEPYLASANGKAYYFVKDDGTPSHGIALRSTDGTLAGTETVIDIGSVTPLQLTTYGGTVYLAIQVGGGTQVGRTSSSGSVEVVAASADPISQFVVVGRTLYYATDTDAFAVNLDTLAAPTSTGVSSQMELLAGNDTTLFLAFLGPALDQYYISFVSPSGPTTGFVSASAIDPAALFPTSGNALYILAGATHDTLYYWDGFSGDPLQTMATGVAKDDVVVDGGTTYFFGTIAGQTGLWSTDGDPADTQLISVFDSVHNLTELDGTLYFFGEEGSSAGLWTSDGTFSGTAFVKASDDVSSFVTFNNTVFFQSGTDNGNDPESWSVGRFVAGGSTGPTSGSGSGSGSGLALTGVDPSGILLVAALALLAGAGLVIVNRRRASRASR
jgi:LPXTG-motif cell wall-anchored protein